MIVWSERPLNAETPAQLLCRSQVTPTDLFFVRNHGTIPSIDARAFRLVVDGRALLALSLGELQQRFPRATVTATIACAGNRRSELRPLPAGIPWGVGAIGNAVWTGARLRDVLLAAGISPDARHVAFDAADEFGGSIPLEKALAPEALLAYEMNGAPLSVEHGFPLRAVVPGFVGARSVKWLTAISVQREPSASRFQRSDYLLDGIALEELRVGSAVCSSRDGAVEGYAIGAGGRPVEEVELSRDGGRTWERAALRGDGGPWTWRLWRAELHDAPAELIVRARDASGASQPESVPSAGNPHGYMNNGWHRLRLR